MFVVFPSHRRVSDLQLMETNQEIRTAVTCIQNELAKILALAGGLTMKCPKDGEFERKLIDEFNTKLRAFRAKNKELSAENKQLKEQVQSLQLEIEQIKKANHITKPVDQERKRKANYSVQRDEPYVPCEPSIQITTKTRMIPPQKKRNIHKDKSPILSSPIKMSDADTFSIQHGIYNDPNIAQDRGGKSHLGKSLPREITSSQFNMLATQYSEASSLPKKVFDFGRTLRQRSQELESDGINSEPELAEQDFVGDSQDEFEPLGLKVELDLEVPEYPSNYTALQRAEFLRNYYRLKLQDKTTKFDLSKNLITEKDWALDDFVPNPKWRTKRDLNSNLGVMTKVQEHKYNDFFKVAGYGVKPTGPMWTDMIDNNKSSDVESDWVKSQVMDKYLSPPGYMVGDFVSTQEAKENKAMIKKKEKERIIRRLESALKVGEFIFYESVFNVIVNEGRVKG